VEFKNKIREMDKDIEYLKNERSILMLSLRGHYDLKSSYIQSLYNQLPRPRMKTAEKIISLNEAKNFKVR
jgi:hypothetical protein